MSTLQWLGLGGLVFGIPFFVLGYAIAWANAKLARGVK